MAEKILLFGSCCSLELGWLCCTFIPAMRYKAYERHWDKVVAVIPRQYNYLCQDFVTDFEHHDKRGSKDRWLLNGKKVPVPKKIRRKYPGAVYYQPSAAKCCKWQRKAIRYGTFKKDLVYDIVIHARAERKYGQSKWNYPKKKYEKVLKEFQGLRVCSVGTRAYHIPGTEDMRNIPLEQLCNIFRSSKVLVGSSSGPMHLGSYCGIQHVVITDNSWQKSIDATNADRYSHIWNPLGTPCKVLQKNNWHPPTKKVVRAIKRFL